MKGKARVRPTGCCAHAHPSGHVVHLSNNLVRGPGGASAHHVKNNKQAGCQQPRHVSSSFLHQTNKRQLQEVYPKTGRKLQDRRHAFPKRWLTKEVGSQVKMQGYCSKRLAYLLCTTLSLQRTTGVVASHSGQAVTANSLNSTMGKEKVPHEQQGRGTKDH